MRLYAKLALATGVPFGVIMGISVLSLSAAVISGAVFGILMSAILGTLQIRADRKAEQQAAAARRIRMQANSEESDGGHANSDSRGATTSGGCLREVP